jgi:hypothetical protein
MIVSFSGYQCVFLAQTATGNLLDSQITVDHELGSIAQDFKPADKTLSASQEVRAKLEEVPTWIATHVTIDLQTFKLYLFNNVSVKTPRSVRRRGNATLTSLTSPVKTVSSLPFGC